MRLWAAFFLLVSVGVGVGAGIRIDSSGSVFIRFYGHSVNVALLVCTDLARIES